MPFKSEKQRRYLWANEPEIARDWTDTYGSGIHKALGGRIGLRGGGMDRHAGTSSASTSYGAPGSASRASAPTHSPDRRSHTVGPTEQYQDRIQNIAAQNQRTSDLRNRASDQGFHQFLTPRDQIKKPGPKVGGLGNWAANYAGANVGAGLGSM